MTEDKDIAAQQVRSKSVNRTGERNAIRDQTTAARTVSEFGYADNELLFEGLWKDRMEIPIDDQPDYPHRDVG
ncbi:hypothetical protein HPQ64_00105 [Rhizobiales bacterium]|uniref:hypothetical protein n=1 Tax=Hongsoonwoonella zoysiae TaxID=2821844 RepID=UPI00155FC069|nr:hypothetical protein [Hongsoonwoonella zoysiae]NRG16087.1 hypothetical protein [Hongsoonwoonella zoysiae]